VLPLVVSADVVLVDLLQAGSHLGRLVLQFADLVVERDGSGQVRDRGLRLGEHDFLFSGFESFGLMRQSFQAGHQFSDFALPGRKRTWRRWCLGLLVRILTHAAFDLLQFRRDELRLL